MRILYFSRDYTPHDHRFLSKMAESEHEIYYLRLENSGQPYEDRPLPEGVTHIPWAGGRIPARFHHGPRLLADLRRVIRTVQPDLIQAGPIQRCAFLVALTGFRPLVTMSWGYDLLHDVNRNRWWRWATRFTLQRSAALVGDCDTIRDLAIHHGMAADRIVTFPWGANIRKFKPTDRRSKIKNYIRARRGWEEAFVLLSTRSWTPLYGVEDLAHAFVRAARQRSELRLLMLGGGPLSGNIKSIIHRAGMIDRVHFPGQVNQNDLPDYYRAADLYISTSHSDGTSISLLEALACGIPVLLTDIPGNREWVTEQERAPSGRSRRVGWLFPDGDVDALQRAILHAVDHRDQLPNMSRAARQLAEERGDWDKNFPKLHHAWKIATSASS